MKKIEVFDPPMCCSSGVCGASVDPVLPRFAADLEWLKHQGVVVLRYNLAQEPMAFVDNQKVSSAIKDDENALPLILVDGVIVSRNVYPGRKALAAFVGITADDLPAACEEQGCCCCGEDAADKPSKCCG